MGEEGILENGGMVWEIIYTTAMLSQLVTLCAHYAMSVRLVKWIVKKQIFAYGSEFWNIFF